jgi:hypothetical protein
MPTLQIKERRRVDAASLAQIIRGLLPIHHAVVELVGPMPRDGSAGSFWFGKAAGVAEGVLAGLGVATSSVSPVVWKRRLDVPASKRGARERATALFGDGGSRTTDAPRPL